VLKPKGDKFLKAGGFTRRYQQEQEKPVEVGGTLAKLQQQNMKLQNLKLSAESKVNDLQKTISKLQTMQYVWWALIIMALIIGYWMGHPHKK
jgi:hypothetical protein